MIQADADQQHGLPPASTDAAHEALLRQLTGALAGGGGVVEVALQQGADAGCALAALGAARDGAVLVFWRDADAALALDSKVGALLAAIADDTVVVVEIATGGAVAQVPGQVSAGEVAQGLCATLPQATVLVARTTELATLTGQDAQAQLPVGLGLPSAYVVCAGAAADLLAEVVEGFVLAAPAAAGPYVAALHAANIELRRANARLAREHLGRFDSAAATVLSRLSTDLDQAQAERDELQTANHVLLAERAELLRRIRMPHHRFVDRVALSLLRIPLLGVLTRARARRG